MIHFLPVIYIKTSSTDVKRLAFPSPHLLNDPNDPCSIGHWTLLPRVYYFTIDQRENEVETKLTRFTVLPVVLIDVVTHLTAVTVSHRKCLQ